MSFGGEKKRDVSLGGTMPFKSLTEIPVGASLNEKILAGLGGAGWGYAPEFVSKTTSPVIASREARWAEQELPAISSEMSAKGLGRSTIAQTGVNRALGQKERDINETLAQAYLQNEQQKKADEARFQQLAQWYTGAEAGQHNIASADEMARRQFQIGTEQARDMQKSQDINRLIGTGIGIVGAPFTGGASLAAVPAMWSGGGGGGGAASIDTIISALERANKTKTTTEEVRKGGFLKNIVPSFQSSYDWIKGQGTTRA